MFLKRPSIFLHPGLGPGLVPAPAGFDVVHAVSLAAPSGCPGAAVGGPRAGGHRPRPGLAAHPRGHHRAGAGAGTRRRCGGPCAGPTLWSPRPRRWPTSCGGRRCAGRGVVVVALGADHLPAPDEPRRPRPARPGWASTGPYLLTCRHPRAPQEPAPAGRRLRRGPAAACPSPGRWWWWGPRGGGTPVARRQTGALPGVVVAGRVADGRSWPALYRRCPGSSPTCPLTEGYGLPPLEAMAVGMPVVASTGVPSVAPAPAAEPPAACGSTPLDVDGHRRGAGARWPTDEPRAGGLVAAGPGPGRPRRTWRAAARAARGAVGVAGREADRRHCAVSLDVTAGAGPPGRGRPLHPGAGRRALARRHDVEPDPGDPPRRTAERWRRWPVRGPAAAGGAGRGAGGPGRSGWPGSRSRLPGALRPAGPRRPPRPPLHDARAGPAAGGGDRPRLHVLRPPRVARAVQGRCCSAGPSGWRPGGRRSIVCVSRTTAERLADGRARVAARWWWPPTGWTTPRFAPTEPRAGADRRPCGPSGSIPERPYVLFVGTLEPRKDVAGLVRAFDRVARAHPDALLVLAGQPGWGADEVDRAMAAAGPRGPGGAHRLRPRRGRAGAAAPGRRRGLSLARGGLRPAGPRGPGLRCAAGHHLGHGHGRAGRDRRPAGAARATPAALAAALEAVLVGRAGPDAGRAAPAGPGRWPPGGPGRPAPPRHVAAYRPAVGAGVGGR